MKDTTVARYSVSQLKARNGFDADESVVLGVDHDRRVQALSAALSLAMMQIGTGSKLYQQCAGLLAGLPMSEP